MALEIVLRLKMELLPLAQEDYMLSVLLIYSNLFIASYIAAAKALLDIEGMDAE